MTQTAPIPNLRAFIGPYTEWASVELHERFSDLSPDHLSLAGAVLVGLGSALAISPVESLRRLSLPVNLAGVATDTFNGALARVCYADDPDSLVRGNKVDSLSDFAKDLAMGMSKIAVASRAGNRLRRPLAELATLTTPLASLSRSYKEQQGYRIEEHGSNYLEFIGTRAARTALHAVASSNVSVRDVPLQPSLDALIVAGNVTRIASNLSASSKEEKSISMRQKARFRTRFHGASVAITGAAILTARNR